jgi:hypothetical protein
MFSQQANQGYASNMAIFPLTMFPSMSPVSLAQQPPEQKKPAPAEESDQDLLEVLALVVLLRILQR